MDSMNTPESDTMKTLKDCIKEGGGIVHADGNLFFTNETKLLATLNAWSAQISNLILKNEDFHAVFCSYCKSTGVVTNLAGTTTCSKCKYHRELELKRIYEAKLFNLGLKSITEKISSYANQTNKG